MTKKTRNIELDRYLRPHAVCDGTAVTRSIVNIIRLWANGEIEHNKATDKRALAAAKKALATDSEWFAIQHKKGDWAAVTKLTPITSVAQAKKLGFKPYKTPAFPERYNPGELVGCQHFTYGQLYAAWRGAFEKMITANADAFPFSADLRAHPDYSVVEGIECAPDAVEIIFESVAAMSREIDAMCVDFYFNDPWNDQADFDDYGFHIEGGYIDKDDIVKKYLPEGSEPSKKKPGSDLDTDALLEKINEYGDARADQDAPAADKALSNIREILGVPEVWKPAKSVFHIYEILDRIDQRNAIPQKTRKDIKAEAETILGTYLPGATYEDPVADNSSECEHDENDPECDWLELWFNYQGKKFHLDFIKYANGNTGLRLWIAGNDDVNISFSDTTLQSLKETADSMVKEQTPPEDPETRTQRLFDEIVHKYDELEKIVKNLQNDVNKLKKNENKFLLVAK